MHCRATERERRLVLAVAAPRHRLSVTPLLLAGCHLGAEYLGTSRCSLRRLARPDLEVGSGFAVVTGRLHRLTDSHLPITTISPHFPSLRSPSPFFPRPPTTARHDSKRNLPALATPPVRTTHNSPLTPPHPIVFTFSHLHAPFSYHMTVQRNVQRIARTPLISLSFVLTPQVCIVHYPT